MGLVRMALLLLLPLVQANDKSARLDALFKEYDGAGVPGASLLVIKDGKILLKKSYGMANLEEKTVSTTNTNYRLASLTKQFTAMAVMMLVERKKLSYDSALTDLFADFPAYGKE